MTDNLKRIYASNVRSAKAYDTVELYHPLFSRTFYFIADVTSKLLQLDDGSYAEFMPFGFSIQKPSTGDKQQDMSFIFSNALGLGSQELEKAAEDIRTPIKLRYRVYMDNSTQAQTETIELSLTNVSTNANSVSATASMVNLFQRRVPARTFEPWVFKGL